MLILFEEDFELQTEHMAGLLELWMCVHIFHIHTHMHAHICTFF